MFIIYVLSLITVACSCVNTVDQAYFEVSVNNLFGFFQIWIKQDRAPHQIIFQCLKSFYHIDPSI